MGYVGAGLVCAQLLKSQVIQQKDACYQAKFEILKEIKDENCIQIRFPSFVFDIKLMR